MLHESCVHRTREYLESLVFQYLGTIDGFKTRPNRARLAAFSSQHTLEVVYTRDTSREYTSSVSTHSVTKPHLENHRSLRAGERGLRLRKFLERHRVGLAHLRLEVDEDLARRALDRLPSGHRRDS